MQLVPRYSARGAIHLFDKARDFSEEKDFYGFLIEFSWK